MSSPHQMFPKAIRPALCERLARGYPGFVSPASSFWEYGPEFIEPWDELLLSFLSYCNAQIAAGEMTPFAIRQVKEKMGSLRIIAFYKDEHTQACVDYLRVSTGGEASLEATTARCAYTQQFARFMAAR